MDPAVRDVIEQWLVIFFPISTFAEIILSITWEAAYFKNGLPLFNKSFPTIPTTQRLTPADFEAQFEGKRGTSLLFRQIDAGSFGFRRPFFHRGIGVPIMHGLITWNDNSTVVTVKGYANWAPLSFLLLVVFIWSGLEHAVGLIVFALAIYALFYVLQVRGFIKVGKFASESWKKSNAEVAPI